MTDRRKDTTETVVQPMEQIKNDELLTRIKVPKPIQKKVESLSKCTVWKKEPIRVGFQSNEI